MNADTLRVALKAIQHEKDLSTVQALPGTVTYICSNDYPCKPDCPACAAPKLLAAALVEARLDEAKWWADLVDDHAENCHCEYHERIADLERQAARGKG